MAKQQDYGFKTPRRRETKNITGFKVGGSLSGGECKVLKSNQLFIENSTKYQIWLPANPYHASGQQLNPKIEEEPKTVGSSPLVFAIWKNIRDTLDKKYGKETDRRE